MSRGFVFAVVMLVIVTGCRSLPGLRVLTGQEDTQTVADRTVQSVELVMADKSGATDPSIIAAADRIEAAATNVDIIEIRQDLDTRIFTVNMLFIPPQADNTLQGQVAYYDSMRRAIELSWQGTMRESEGSERLRVRLMAPQTITTLDNGTSFIGRIYVDSEIERGTAASYLAGERSLATFFDLALTGMMSFDDLMDTLPLYQGQPNHPMFMMPSNGP